LQWSEEDELNEGERLANILAIDDDDDLFSQLEAYDSLSSKCTHIFAPLNDI